MLRKLTPMQVFLLLCLGYFLSYMVFGVSAKYFTRIAEPNLNSMAFLVASLIGSMVITNGVVIGWRWWRHLKPEERPYLKWIILSGVATGFVIPTTSLMYTFAFSVMVAMIIMRALVIIIGVLVNLILLWQGRSTKQIYWQEWVAVFVSMGALAIIILKGGKAGSFDFLHSAPFLVIMGFYIIPYAGRIYIMSYLKDTSIDKRAFFGIEQLSATTTVLIATFLAVMAFKAGFTQEHITLYSEALASPYGPAIFWSMTFGVVAFCSVFLYIYKTGSPTFNVTANRLTSLMAGTGATILLWLFLGQRAVRVHEWQALFVIMVAMVFLTWAGKRRANEAKTA